MRSFVFILFCALALEAAGLLITARSLENTLGAEAAGFLRIGLSEAGLALSWMGKVYHPLPAIPALGDELPKILSSFPGPW